jgi:hypothetical protein
VDQAKLVLDSGQVRNRSTGDVLQHIRVDESEDDMIEPVWDEVVLDLCDPLLRRTGDAELRSYLRYSKLNRSIYIVGCQGLDDRLYAGVFESVAFKQLPWRRRDGEGAKQPGNILVGSDVSMPITPPTQLPRSRSRQSRPARAAPILTWSAAYRRASCE